MIETTMLMLLRSRLFSLPCNDSEKENRKVKGKIELLVLRKYREELYRVRGREIEGQRQIRECVHRRQ